MLRRMRRMDLRIFMAPFFIDLRIIRLIAIVIDRSLSVLATLKTGMPTLSQDPKPKGREKARKCTTEGEEIVSRCDFFCI